MFLTSLRRDYPGLEIDPERLRNGKPTRINVNLEPYTMEIDIVNGKVQYASSDDSDEDLARYYAFSKLIYHTLGLVWETPVEWVSVRPRDNVYDRAYYAESTIPIENEELMRKPTLNRIVPMRVRIIEDYIQNYTPVA